MPLFGFRRWPVPVRLLHTPSVVIVHRSSWLILPFAHYSASADCTPTVALRRGVCYCVVGSHEDSEYGCSVYVRVGFWSEPNADNVATTTAETHANDPRNPYAAQIAKEKAAAHH